MIFLWHPEPRAKQAKTQPAVLGEQQKSGGRAVQATHREDRRRKFGQPRPQAESIVRIARRSEHPFGFVEGKIMRGRAQLNRCAVEQHTVFGEDQTPRLQITRPGFAARRHLDAAFLPRLIDLTTRQIRGVGEEFVQPPGNHAGLPIIRSRTLWVWHKGGVLPDPAGPAPKKETLRKILSRKDEEQPIYGRAHKRGERPFNIIDRKSTRLNSSHVRISYAVFCLK